MKTYVFSDEHNCDHTYVLAADAQATIAALQARVRGLEEWKHIVTGAGTDQESVIRLAAYEYTKIAVQCWKEANAKLESQLTQRTAELEAVKDAAMYAGERLGIVLVERDDLQAELERVRGELAETKEVEAALSSKVAEYEVELNGDPQNFYGRGRTVGLRTLIAALPKVEGEINERFCTGSYYSSPRDYRSHVTFETALVALLKHRQGMEG